MKNFVKGLPHAHIILWVEERLTTDKIDRVICAEIPSPQENLTLHNLVKKHMIHGPCGHLNRMSICMVENKCSRQYVDWSCFISIVLSVY